MSKTTITTPRKGLYLVRRTSMYEGSPCPDAFIIERIFIDTRNCDDPKKIPANNGKDGDWFLRGTNHRVENGMIKRDLGTIQEWAVEIPDILAFVDKYGECVVGRNSNGFYEIEIYDDYRE